MSIFMPLSMSMPMPIPMSMTVTISMTMTMSVTITMPMNMTMAMTMSITMTMFMSMPSWDSHMLSIRQKVTRNLGVLRRVKPLLKTENLIVIYRSIIEPYFTYCCIVWDSISETQIVQLVHFVFTKSTTSMLC